MPEKILIVEDNPQNMKVVQLALRPHGYALLQATDGEEALEIATRHEPDLIIMDIQLPKMNGLEVTRRLRQMPAFKYMPIIAVTAYAMKGDEKKTMEAGCNAYLTKPVNTRELPKIVADLLLRQEQDNARC